MRRSVICAAILLFVAAAGRSALASPCDARYVQVSHKHIAVSPTGGDDTVNLQCAVDLGATLGPGVTIRLAAGTFNTAQLVVQGLRGAIRGMGQGHTVIHNLDTPLPIDRPDCSGPGPCFADAPPAPDNRYPTLISIIGTDVAMSDLTVDVLGTHVCQPWTIWGFPVDGFSEVIQFIGSHASFDIARITVTGPPLAPDNESGLWGGTGGGVLMWSFSRPWSLTGSTLVVTDSTFRAGGGVWAYNLDRSRVTIARNRFELLDFVAATAVSDTRDSQVSISDNEVVALGVFTTGVFGWPGNLGTGMVSTRLFIDNNVFSGDSGIVFVPGTFDGVTCLAVNNDMSQVANPYVFDSSTPCKVVGNGGPGR